MSNEDSKVCTLQAAISISHDGEVNILIPAKQSYTLDESAMKSLQLLKSWCTVEEGQTIHGDTLIHARVESIDYTRANLIGVHVPLSSKVATTKNPNPEKSSD